MAKNEARLGMDITDFEKKLTKATNELNKFARGGAANLGNLGNAIGTMTGSGSSGVLNLVGAFGGLAAAFGATASAAEIMKSSIDGATSFEKSLSGLKALTGLGSSEMAYFKDAAIQLGSTTTQTASQVVDAFKLIGSAKPELLKDKEALKDVTSAAITLSEAAGMAVPEAAKALTGVLNQFGISASGASDVINLLAAASQQGAGDINYLNDAIVKAGSVATSMNVNVEEVVSCLEQLAQAGVDASSAGTGLRNIMLALAKTGDKSLDPAVNGLIGSLNNLKNKGISTVEMMNLFGKENIASAQVLMNTAEKADNLKSSITGTNTAYEQAKINTDNFAGSVDSLNSAWEGLMLTINSSNGWLRYWVDRTTNLIKNIQWLIASSGQRVELMADVQFNGTDGTNGLKSMMDNTLKQSIKAGELEGVSVGRALRQLESWYNGVKKNNKLTTDELSALSKAYERAKKYVTSYFEAKDGTSSTNAAATGGGNGNGNKNKTKILPEGSIGRLKQQIQEAEKAASEAVGTDAQVQAAKLVEELKRNLNEQECIVKIQLEADNYDPIKDFEDSINQRAANIKLDDEPITLEQANNFSDGNFEKLSILRTEIKETKKEILSASLDMADGLVSLGDTIANLESTFDSCTTAWDYFSASIKTAISITDGIVSVIETYNTLTELSTMLKTKEAAATGMSTTAKIADSTASGTNAASEAAETAASGVTSTAKVLEANTHIESAAAKFFDAHSWMPLVGIGIAGAAVGAMIASLSSLPKFAEGAYADRPTMGIFGEAGPELVLPERKLDEAFERHQSATNGKVEFILQNNTLRGWLEQTEKKQSRKV